MLNSVTAQYAYTLCLKKNPCDYVFDDNMNSKRPIVIIFGTVITIKTIGHRNVVSLSHFTYFVQLPYPGNLLNLKIRLFIKITKSCLRINLWIFRFNWPIDWLRVLVQLTIKMGQNECTSVLTQLNNNNNNNKLCAWRHNMPPPRPLYAHCGPPPVHSLHVLRQRRPARLAPWIFMIDRQQLALGMV